MIRALRARRDDEAGVVLVFLSMTLVIMLAMAGFIVDITNWNLQGTKVQRAADAAALAGAVFLPENPTQAVDTAKQIAARNGYTSGVTATQVAGHPSQMQVTISTDVTSYFAEVVGITSKTVTKTGIGEYEKPIAMGSPTNQFGNDPAACTTLGAHGTPSCPDFWANVAGKNTTKISGDRYTAGVCSDGVDRCPSNYATAPNGDYDPFGNVFAINVTQSGTLRVQVFDPALVHVGDHCEQADSDLAQIQSKAPSYRLSAATYAPGDTNPSCTGDNDFSGGRDTVSTTYTVRGPSPLPASAAASPVISLNSCQPATFPGVTGDLIGHFNANDAPASGLATPTGFRGYFRQWVTVCTANVQPGTYYLQVQAPSGNGHNRFGVRATVNSSTSGVNVYGDQHMAIYANANAANTTFYLARLPSSAASHTLVVDLFDIGDAGSTGTLTLVPPSDWGGSFTGCTFQKGVTGSVDDSPRCSVGGVSSSNGFNGKIDEFRVPVPSTYQCADADPEGCWVKIRLSFSGDVEDTTTWSAHLEGDPVRLVH